MSQKGHATGMAGEFHVMELLFRLGHEPALTLGNAESVGILTRSPQGHLYAVSVKTMRGGRGWDIGNQDYSYEKNLIFVLLHYKKFSDLAEFPEIWVVPGARAEKIKRLWHKQFGLYINKEHAHELYPYKDAWKNLD